MKSLLESNTASHMRSVESLRKMLEQQQKRLVSTEEAELIGESLVEFFEALLQQPYGVEGNRGE